jgi:hypothetical protein
MSDNEKIVLLKKTDFDKIKNKTKEKVVVEEEDDANSN